MKTNKLDKLTVEMTKAQMKFYEYSESLTLLGITYNEKRNDITYKKLESEFLETYENYKKEYNKINNIEEEIYDIIWT